MLIKVITWFPYFFIIFFSSGILLSLSSICHSKIKEGFFFYLIKKTLMLTRVTIEKRDNHNDLASEWVSLAFLVQIALTPRPLLFLPPTLNLPWFFQPKLRDRWGNKKIEEITFLLTSWKLSKLEDEIKPYRMKGWDSAF